MWRFRLRIDFICAANVLRKKRSEKSPRSRKRRTIGSGLGVVSVDGSSPTEVVQVSLSAEVDARWAWAVHREVDRRYTNKHRSRDEL